MERDDQFSSLAFDTYYASFCTRVVLLMLLIS